jgi:hypothetical protein
VWSLVADGVVTTFSQEVEAMFEGSDYWALRDIAIDYAKSTSSGVSVDTGDYTCVSSCARPSWLQHSAPSGTEECLCRYGEFDLDLFLDLLSAADPRPGDVFIDVGSGNGRLVLASALAYQPALPRTQHAPHPSTSRCN